MANYEIWTEGYRATGESSGAQYHGTFQGESFRDAVSAFRDSLYDNYSKRCIDLDRLTFWGCRFYDNGRDARASFG